MTNWFFGRSTGGQSHRKQVYPSPEITLRSYKSPSKVFRIDVLSWDKLLFLAKGLSWFPRGTLSPPYMRGRFDHPNYLSFDEGGYYADRQLVTDEDLARDWSLSSQTARALAVRCKSRQFDQERLILFALRPVKPDLVKSIEGECRRLLNDESIVLVDFSGHNLSSVLPAELQAGPLYLPSLIKATTYRVMANFLLSPEQHFAADGYGILENFIKFCRNGEFTINLSDTLKEKEESRNTAFDDLWARQKVARAQLKVLLLDESVARLKPEEKLMDAVVKNLPEVMDAYLWEQDLRKELQSLKLELMREQRWQGG